MGIFNCRAEILRPFLLITVMVEAGIDMEIKAAWNTERGIHRKQQPRREGRTSSRHCMNKKKKKSLYLGTQIWVLFVITVGGMLLIQSLVP